MAIKFFLRDPNVEPCTGAANNFDLNKTQSSPPTTQACNRNDPAFGECGRFKVDVTDTWADGTHSVSIDISSVAGTLEWRYRLERLDGSCVSQAQSGWSAVYTDAGIKTDNLTLNGGSGTRLILVIESRRTGSHGNVTVSIETQDADSFVDTPFTSGATNFTKALTEDISGLADSIARLAVYTRATTENVSATFADAISRTYSAIRALAEDVSATFVDAIARTLSGFTAFTKSLAEDVSGTFSDAVSRAWNGVRNLNENVSAAFADAASRIANFWRKS